MNIKEAKEEIRKTVLAYLSRDDLGIFRIPVSRQRPVLLMGPPGIGKTAIMDQVAREAGLGLVSYTMTHHTRQSAIGLPRIRQRNFDNCFDNCFDKKEYFVTEYTLSEILASVYDQIDKTGKRDGILFLDEINCVSETLMPAMLQFLQYKTFGNHHLPEGWVIVAAGNPVRYNQSVRELDMAVADRVKWIEIEPDLDVWMNYARERSLHPAVMSFLNWKPESFYAVSTDRISRNFVTARGWEDLSDMLLVQEELGFSISPELAGQYLQHEGIAREFSVYYKLYLTCREKPFEEMANCSFDERLCMIMMMVQKACRLSDELNETQKLKESLGYFLEGLQRKWHKEDGDKALLALLQAQLELRQAAYNTRKSLGALSFEEEKHEARLLAFLKEKSGIWRVELSERGRFSDNFMDPQDIDFGELFDRLENLISDYIKYFQEKMPGSQEEYLFVLGLAEHKNAADFLKKHMPDTWAYFQDIMDLDGKKKQILQEM